MYGHDQARECKKSKTVQFDVFVAGDVCEARRALREYCYRSPCCVTLTPTQFVYRGGLEDGVVVGVREYPRFPSTPVDLRARAQDIGEALRLALSQDSFMVVEHGGDTAWHTSRREEVASA